MTREEFNEIVRKLCSAYRPSGCVVDCDCASCAFRTSVGKLWSALARGAEAEARSEDLMNSVQDYCMQERKQRARADEAEAKLAAVEARLAEMQNDFGRGWHDACDEIEKVLGSVSHGA